MDRIRSLGQLERAGQSYFVEVKGRKAGTGAHGFPHARNTSRGALPVGTLLGMPNEAIRLGTASGLLHDFKRSDSEDPSLRDEEASAILALDFLTGLNDRGAFTTSDEQREAVAYAIRQHGEYPDYWKNPATRNVVPADLNEQVRILNFVPDKGDANGAQVIARRAMHVAGGRMLGEKADLPKFGFNPHTKSDQLAVVVIEGAIRLSIINPQDIYPDALAPFVNPLYEVQRPFMHGLCQAAGLSVEGIAQLILERKNANGQNMLDERKLEAPRNVHGLTKLFRFTGGLSDVEIRTASPELVQSAVRTVEYFRAGWNQDYDAIVADWRPQTLTESSWKSDLLEYNSGRWFRQITAQARQLRG